MKRLLCLALCALLLLASAGCASDVPDPEITSLAPDEAHQLTVYTSHKEEVYGPSKGHQIVCH